MKKRKLFLIGIGFVIVSLSVVGFSYAYWMLSMNQSDQNVVYSDCFQMSFTGENAIHLQNAYPMTKEELKTDFFPKAEPYHFTITNICSNIAHASINLESLPIDQKIADEYIDVILYPGEDDINDDPEILSNKSYKLTDNEENKSKVIPEAEKAYQLTNISLNGKEKKEYNLLIFLDEETPPMKNSQWKGKITINSAYEYQYSEDILNGAIPDLSDGKLIPVQISETELPTGVEYSGDTAGGKVTKADVTKEWYSYENKKWANAVILRDGVTDHYKAGDEIEEKDIESYFVWIPRYKYKLKENEETYNTYKSVTEIGNVESVSDFYNNEQVKGNKGASEAYEIEFENNTIKPSVTTKAGEWLTHPAFTAFDSNGFWVGKFETGYNQNSDTSKEITTTGWTKENAQNNTNNEEPSKVIIKPNVYSWRSIQVANAFYTSYKYQRELDSHMMKNSEWGAVAYLTQSKYGRCDGSSCEEVRINNSQNYVTGASNKKSPTCGYTITNEECNHYEAANLTSDSANINNYLNQESGKSSTTGNHSGIYDMSGGAWEYVMGVMQSGTNDKNPASGRSNTYNSGFKGVYTCPQCDNNSETVISNTDGKNWPSSKYYDLYDYKTTNQEYQRGHLGDGTKEFGPFYSVGWPKTGNTYYTRYVGSYNASTAMFIYKDAPWFIRGLDYSCGVEAGPLSFAYTYGQTNSNGSFRIILTP